MLISIRNKATGWIAWVIVGIITVPFAFFGINSYFEGANQVNVATINGDDIPLQDFQREMDQRRRTFQQQFGDNFNPAMVDNPGFRSQIVESMISSRLIRQYAQDNGLRISDDALRERIVSAPYFQEEGKFNPETYRRLLSSNGLTTEGFEQQERINGATQQLSEGISNSSFTNKDEVDRLLALNLQERTADYVIVAAQPFLETIEVSDDEIQTEYDANPNAYQQAARLKAEYVELTIEGLAAEIEVDDDEITQAYETSKAQYTSPEARKASHILLSVPKSADDKKIAEIKAKAESILAEANEGVDFSKLAEAHSEDPGSRRNGGDLGLIAKGQMVPPFEEAVFSMQADEVRGPIKTSFGFHIIKLTELTPEGIKPLEEVRDAVEKAEKKRLAETRFFDQSETLRTLVFENPDSLEQAATELGLTVQTSDWFEQQSGTGIMKNSKLRNAAFSDEVLQDNLNSEAIEVGENQLIAVRKSEYESAHTKPLDTVKAEIEADLKSAKAAEAAEEVGQAVIAKLVAGETLVEELEATRTTLPTLRKESTSGPQRAIADAVFTATRPGDSPTIDGLRLDNGDYAVYTLSDVKAGDPASAEESDRNRINQQLNQRDGLLYFSAFQRQLRVEADVEIFSSVIEDDETLSNYN